MNFPVFRSVLKIVVTYLVAGGLWFLLSDRLLIAPNFSATNLKGWALGKGLGFVLVTAGLLAHPLYREFKSRAASEDLVRRSNPGKGSVFTVTLPLSIRETP